MDKRKAREIMREHQEGFVKLNPRWCAIEELISDSEKLDKIEQIVNDYDTNCGLEEYMYLEQIQEVLEQE